MAESIIMTQKEKKKFPAMTLTIKFISFVFCCLEGHVGNYFYSFLKHPGYTERREVAKSRCCLMPSRRLCVEPPLCLLRLPNSFYRATTDWRVVLIRGDGFGGCEEERRRGEERLPHPNSFKLLRSRQQRERERETWEQSRIMACSWEAVKPPSFVFNYPYM